MNTKSVTTVTKTKEKSNKQKGDEGESFVQSILQVMKYITEIHPRTFRPVFLQNGKKIMVSQDNDFHKSFDIKAERYDGMIYSQVKWMSSGETLRSDVKKAKDKIDRNYPYLFPYQHVQVWMVWREWVKNDGERRHKEWKFRIWERGNVIEYNENGYHFFKWIWKEITDEVRKEYESYHTSIKNTSEMVSECNITSELKEQPQIVSKSKMNKKHSIKVVK